MSRRTALLIPFLTLATALAQQPSPAPAPANEPSRPLDLIPTISTTVRQVVLDLVVTDKHGHAIKGLQPSDIILTEDKVPQHVVHFSERDSDAAPPPIFDKPNLPPNTFQNHAPLTGNGPITVILFDELSFQDAAYARYEVSQYMKSVTPGTPICIFKLDRQGLHLIQDFTTDAQVLREAVTSKRNQQIMPLPGYSQTNLVSDAMAELAMYLSGFSGRKNLIWFTDGTPPYMPTGLPTDPFPDLNTFIDDPQQTADILILSRVALYPINARGLVVNSAEGRQVMLDGMALNDLAHATGGKAFYNTNGFKQAVAEVVTTGSNYYTLAYNPANSNWDGKYRKIKIELTANALADAYKRNPSYVPAPPFKLEYRQGFFANDSGPHVRSGAAAARKRIAYSPKGDPNGPGAEVATSFQRSLFFGAVAPFQIMFRAQVTPTPVIQKIKRKDKPPPADFIQPRWIHQPYREYEIHFGVKSRNVEFVPSQLSDHSTAIDFGTVVYADDGAIVNSLIETIHVNLTPDVYNQVLQGGMGFTQTIAVPVHGNYFLRLAVHDRNSDHLGALEIPLENVKLLPPDTSVKLKH